MPDLRMVLGPLSALEDTFAESVIAARAADALAPVTVLVGQTLLKRYLPRMLAMRGIAHINVRFVLADELAESLARDSARGSRTSPNAERLLVRLAAQAAGDYFGEIARGDGFTDALLRLFRELERGGFTPESLASASATAGLAGDKAGDLVRMYASFQGRRTAAGLLGPAGFYASADASLFAGPLIIYGLWNPAAVQARLIENISAIRDCTVFLPEAGLDADGAHVAFRARVSDLGAHIQHVANEPTTATATAHLSRRVFRTPEHPIESEGIQLVSAPNTVREVWEAARACMSWAREGIGFHEMAVVYRNREPYSALVDEIFREAQIGTYMHDGRLLSTHPLGRRLLLLLELLADETFSRQRVMEFLTETRIPRETRERFPRLRPSEWEAFTREAGVVAGIEQWRTQLQRLADEKRARAADERYAWLAHHADRVLELRAFVEELHAALSNRSKTATWHEHLAFVHEIATSYADGLEPLLKALDELAALSSVAGEVSFATVLTAVRDDLDARDVTDVLGEPLREFGKHGVAVLDASSLRHMRFRAVYMLGMAERAWPPPMRPDPLLLEHEREAVNAVAPANARLPLRTSPDEEALMFVLAIEAARERLTISYARADAGGSGRHLPSYFFRAAAQAMEGRELRVVEVEEAACVRRLAAGRLSVDEPGDSVTPAEYDRGLIRETIAGTQRGVIDALAQFDAANPLRTGGAIRRAVTARRQRWDSTLSAYDGTMRSDAALARAAAVNFGRVQAISPSRLEKYAHCPYQYFLRYGLGIEDIDEPEDLDRIDQLERGSLIHAILERFLKQIGRDDPPAAVARERHLTVLLEVASSEAKEREDRGVTGRPLIWALDRRQIFEDLVRWYDKEVEEGAYTSLRPGGYEVGFGGVTFGYGGNDDPLTTDEPLILDVSGRELLLQGRIDRIDWDAAKTHFRVIDYKTGRSGGKPAFDKGRSLQLPLYMHAASSALGIPVEDGEAQYFYCTSKGGFKRSEIAGVELQGRAEELEQVLGTIVEGVNNGFFAPNPGKGAFNCTWCEYTNICDSRIEHIMARKLDDPRASAFIALQEIK